MPLEAAPLIQFSLPDGRELVARPPIIGETFNVEGGGRVTQEWDIHRSIIGPCLTMLVMLEKPFGPHKLFIPPGVSL